MFLFEVFIDYYITIIKFIKHIKKYHIMSKTGRKLPKKYYDAMTEEERMKYYGTNLSQNCVNGIKLIEQVGKSKAFDIAMGKAQAPNNNIKPDENYEIVYNRQKTQVPNNIYSIIAKKLQNDEELTNEENDVLIEHSDEIEKELMKL